MLSGNLSYQIEHHLFPDIPAYRYKEIAVEVKALCEKYGIRYNEAPMANQLWSVWKQVLKLSLPDSTYTRGPLAGLREILTFPFRKKQADVVGEQGHVVEATFAA